MSLISVYDRSNQTTWTSLREDVMWPTQSQILDHGPPTLFIRLHRRQSNLSKCYFNYLQNKSLTKLIAMQNIKQTDF